MQQRPTGVTLISIIFFFFGALALLGGFALLVMTPPNIPPITDLITPYIIALGVTVIIMGGVEIANGWGLWNLQNWARILSIILMGIAAVSDIFSGLFLLFGIDMAIFNAPEYGRLSLPGQGIASIFVGLLYAWGVFYLLKADVMAAFYGNRVDPTIVSSNPITMQEMGVGVAMAPPPPPPPPVVSQPPVAPMSRPTEVFGTPNQAVAWLVPKGGRQKSYSLNGNNITIGRDPNRAAIVLNGDTISGEHARIRVEGNQYYLHDLASTNGTFVNNHRTQRQLLRDGDIVRFGQIEMVFKKA